MSSEGTIRSGVVVLICFEVLLVVDRVACVVIVFGLSRITCSCLLEDLLDTDSDIILTASLDVLAELFVMDSPGRSPGLVQALSVRFMNLTVGGL